MRICRTRHLALLLLSLLAAIGCDRGPNVSTARLEGRVVYHGKPVERGSVSFSPREAGQGKSVGAPIENGRYSAAAVPLGKVLLQINAVQESGKTVSEFGKATVELVNIVPDRYRQGALLDVSGDRLDLDFDLSE